MKIVLFGLGLMLATTAQAAKLTYTWDKKEIEALKGKEIYSVYCTPKVGGFTQEVCDRVSKSASFKKFKFKTLEWVDSTTIRVGDGPRTVEIKQGNRPGLFVVNGKTFEYGTDSHEEIRKKIAAAMPRVAQDSFFFNIAYAEEAGNVVSELSDCIDLMGSYQSDEVRCDIAKRVFLLCSDGGAVMPGTENVISAMRNYQAARTPSEQKQATTEAYYAIENFKKLMTDARNFMWGSHELQKSKCIVKFKGMELPTEDASRMCTTYLENFKTDFDNSTLQTALNSAMKRTVHKDLTLKYDELVLQLQAFYRRGLTDWEKGQIKEKVEEAAKPVQ